MSKKDHHIFINNTPMLYCTCDKCLKEFNGAATYDKALNCFESIYKRKKSWISYLLAIPLWKKD